MKRSDDSLTSGTRYDGKKDLWLVILLLAMTLFFLYTPVIIFSEPVHILVKLFGSLFFLAMALLMQEFRGQANLFFPVVDISHNLWYSLFSVGLPAMEKAAAAEAPYEDTLDDLEEPIRR